MEELILEEFIKDFERLYWANDKLIKDNKKLANMNIKLLEQAKEDNKKNDAFIQVLEDVQKVVEREKLDHLFKDIKLNL